MDVAQSFEAEGLTHLHLVDLDGAKAGKVINWKVVESLTKNTQLKIDFGGGIKTAAEIERLFSLGIEQVNIGSIAVKEPEKVKGWMNEFGAGKIILSADVKNNEVAIHGWQEASGWQIEELIESYAEGGLKYVTCTDISTDGMLQGPNFSLYENLVKQFPEIHFIASGGVSELNDLIKLKNTGVYGAIVGKAIYENKIAPEALSSIQ